MSAIDAKAAGQFRIRDLNDHPPSFEASGDGAPVERGDPASERVDEAVQLVIGKRLIGVSVSFRGVAIEVVGAENDFERTAAADKMWETFRAAAAGMQSDPDLGLAQSRVLARSEAQVARPEAGRE